ncbi:hypothetical protein PR001_g25388 [Phytophthora rubi]|uniref:Uncharacterized protein n=1 Tax=Phytophthora rubi TaxID=129364 RepID=A0A6A3J2P7_9STRA|nr:hypothetical protein PR001_g25388 [Phytophthora rubi]KAE8987688.1 hypothetical protein PR002_g21978 [Phytophthora rubi]
MSAVEEGEEAKESSSSGRSESSVGTRRPREDDSDASSSKRSRSGSDRPLADAGALSTPRGGDDDDSTPSAAVTSCTNPVRDPWMPSPSEIQSRYGSTSPLGRYALYSCSAITDDVVTKELDFDPATDQRRDYYIGLFHELRFYGNKKHSRKSKVAEWETLCQSWGAFVKNFNRDPAGYRERVRSASERYERFSKRPKILRLHDGAVEAGIPCAVPAGVACGRCQAGAVRLSGRDLNGYTGISVPVELKTLREKLITQLSSESAEGERNTQPRAVGNYSSRSSFTPFGGAAGGGIRTPSPFPERRSSGRSAAPTYRGQERILTNEYENEPDLGSGSDDQRFAGQSSEFPHVRLATGAAAGRHHGPSPAEVWDRLEAVERPPLPVRGQDTDPLIHRTGSGVNRTGNLHRREEGVANQPFHPLTVRVVRISRPILPPRHLRRLSDAQGGELGRRARPTGDQNTAEGLQLRLATSRLPRQGGYAAAVRNGGQLLPTAVSPVPSKLAGQWKPRERHVLLETSLKNWHESSAPYSSQVTAGRPGTL